MRDPIMGVTTVVGLVALIVGCSTRPEPYMGSPTRGQMLSHFDLALEARSYAIQGDLEGFREATSELADLKPARDLPAEVLLQLGPMRWEAREAALAETPEEAARASARLAVTCGECHVASDVALGDRFTLGGPPPAGSIGRHMAGLAWASRLLWDGLIGPSDRTWFTGAQGLIELGALPDGMPIAIPPGDVAVAGARLRQLGERATYARDPELRVEVLTDVWTTCATCHIRTRSSPP